MADKLPCVELLEATPAILRGLMSEISEEERGGSPRRTASRSPTGNREFATAGANRLTLAFVIITDDLIND